MKVIDTTGTNIKVYHEGKNQWFYSLDGVNFTKATFKQCLEVLSNARNNKLANDIAKFQSRRAEFLKQLAK
jgi:hypothetical protein